MRTALDTYEEGALASRLAAVESLESTADEAAIGALGNILREDADREIRRRALDALRRIGGDDAARALEQGLGDADRELRATVIAALGEGRTDRAVASLGRVLFGDPDAELRARAVTLLGEHENEAARAMLEAARRDPDGRVRAAADRALKLR